MEGWPQAVRSFEFGWVFEGAAVRISRWRCRAPPRGRGPERAQPAPILLFLHSGSFRVDSSDEIGLLDCTRVGFFNGGVPFQSEHPYGGGDSGSDLAIRPDILVEILGRHDAGAADRTDHPFPVGWGPCAADAFLLHRALLRKISAGAAGDALEVEELSLALAERVIVSGFAERKRPPGSPPATRREREEAEALRGYLSARPGARHLLDALARRFGSSPFRLCRSFRAATGMTIHRYLTGVRLRHAIDRLTSGCRDITDLALDLGFSSHSHFTAVFRRSLGVTPEGVRRLAARGGLASFRENVIPAKISARI